MSGRHRERSAKSTAHDALISRKIQWMRDRQDDRAVPRGNLLAVGVVAIETSAMDAGRVL
jgi:hypothetical protein